MKKLLSLTILLFFLLPLHGKKTDERLAPEYQIEGAGMTSQNAQQVKIIVLSNKKDISDADLEKAAVHGILFRDYDDETNAGFGSVASHKSILDPTVEAEYSDFFKSFFSSGDYSKYVELVGDTRRVVKAGKQWKISATVKVNSAALKKMLKKQGMVKDLGGGW